jgi:hypothetical protein
MTKKTLKVIGLVIFAAVLISIFVVPVPVISKAPDTGTCCPQQNSICVTPTENILHYYYLESGPCP